MFSALYVAYCFVYLLSFVAPQNLKGQNGTTMGGLYCDIFYSVLYFKEGLPWCSVVKNLPASTGDMCLIPGLGRSPGGGNGNPLQCSCLGHPLVRGAWQAPVHGVAKSQI